MIDNNDFNNNEGFRPSPVKPPMAPQVEEGYNPTPSQAPEPRIKQPQPAPETEPQPETPAQPQYIPPQPQVNYVQPPQPYPQGFNPPPYSGQVYPNNNYPRYETQAYYSPMPSFIPNTPPQAPVQPAAQQPVQPPVQPNPFYETKTAKTESSSEPMSGRLKAFTIIMVALLVSCLVGFISFLVISKPDEKANNYSFSTDNFETTPDFNFEVPDETEEETDGYYPDTDAKDKTNPDFKGIKLHKRPEKSKDSGSSYAFGKVETSVVAVIGYVTGQDGSATSYSSMGTGTIVTSDGYIVTNSHIISDSRTAYMIKVITSDNKEYDAGIVGYDSRCDLAVLKIDAKNLTPVTFGNSDDIVITEDVIAVGNPRSLKYQNSVTKGIVSAKDRNLSIMNNVKCIQTDAAINPGNSGGPLVNMYGQVIGINSAKIVLAEYEGMSFAIPSTTVKTVVDDIIRHNHVLGRVRIGITGTVVYIDDNNNTGIRIESINENGPMDIDNVEKGDIITAMDDTEIQNFGDIYEELEKHKAGDNVTITLYRPSEKKSHDVQVKLEEDVIQ